MGKRIIVKPLAGLSNRLRAIESALSLGHTVGAPVEVVWANDHQMAAFFDQLFIVPSDFSLFQYDKYKYARSSFSLKGVKKVLSKITNWYYGVETAVSELDVVELLWTKKLDLATWCRGKNSYFFTCQQFFPFRYNYSWLKPVPEVQQKLDRFVAAIGGRNCIGIHIRRTDHDVAIAQSPDFLFEQAIEKEMAGDENVVFFLATDDSNTEKHFVNKYGRERIVTNPKQFGRDSVEATRDAVVDLLSLTKCSKLYCSYWSSFSETAAVISGAETIICRTDIDKS